MNEKENPIIELVKEEPLLGVALVGGLIILLITVAYVKQLESSHNVFIEVLEDQCALKCFGNSTYQLITNANTGLNYLACSCDPGFIDRWDNQKIL